jgi:hypothetical protein
MYACLSEEWTDYHSYEPPDYGRIARLIAARNRGAARYAAFRSEFKWGLGIEEMPRMSVRLAQKNVPVPPGDYTVDERFQKCWEVLDEVNI